MMHERKQRVGVFGIGAIGSVISFELQKSKELISLSYYSRTPNSSIRLFDGKAKYQIPILIHTLPSKVQKLDWLIVCIKENHYEAALNWLSNLISSETKIAVIRNGLRLKEPFLDFTAESNILECIIDCPTQPNTDGFYQLLKKAIITTPNSELANQFIGLFKNSKVEFKRVLDFKTESWKKVCESSALGSILCLSGETCWIFKDEKLRKLYVDILEEGLKVAQADGAKVESDFVDRMVEKLLSYSENKGSSMLTDRINGNPIELGAKNKIISELGEVYGIETPINNLVVTLLSHTNKKETHK